MSRVILLDTGPLVALLDRRDRYHSWAKEQFAQLTSSVWTCEAVLAEACYLVRTFPAGSRSVLEMIRRDIIKVSYRLAEDAEAVSHLLEKYSGLPMSLADACMVRMAEQHADCAVLTLDRDFRIYRRHKTLLIPTLMPDDL